DTWWASALSVISPTSATRYLLRAPTSSSPRSFSASRKITVIRLPPSPRRGEGRYPDGPALDQGLCSHDDASVRAGSSSERRRTVQRLGKGRGLVEASA